MWFLFHEQLSVSTILDSATARYAYVRDPKLDDGLSPMSAAEWQAQVVNGRNTKGLLSRFHTRNMESDPKMDSLVDKYN